MIILKRLLPHLCMILSFFFLILLVLNDYNPSMNFIGNHISLFLLGALCVTSIAASLVTLRDKRHKEQRS